MVKNGNWKIYPRSAGWSTPHGQEWQFQVSIVSGFYCYSSYRQITWQINPPVHTSSGQEWQFQLSIVSYRQINWQIYPPLQASSGQEWQIQISIVSYRQINWQIYPPQEASSGQEWQLQISIVPAHIGIPTGRSNPPHTKLVSSSQEWQIYISTIRTNTGGSRLSRTAVKPDSCLAQIFFAKFFCIIKLIIVIG